MESHTNNPAAEAIVRILAILGPVATLYTPPMPSCECRTGAPCKTCKGYSDAGNALASAARRCARAGGAA